MTIRKAVRLLKDEGLVHTVPGRGSFVVKRDLNKSGPNALVTRWLTTGALLSSSKIRAAATRARMSRVRLPGSGATASLLPGPTARRAARMASDRSA
jgi:DNA-binding GntR family transcriptional regulator